MGNIMSNFGFGVVSSEEKPFNMLYNGGKVMIKGTVDHCMMVDGRLTIQGEGLSLDNTQGLELEEVNISEDGSTIVFRLPVLNPAEIVSNSLGQIKVNYGKIHFCTGVTIIGDHNVITGDESRIVGHHNDIYGNLNRVVGDHNTILGDGNSMFGDHNQAYGKGNEATGEHNQDSLTVNDL